MSSLDPGSAADILVPTSGSSTELPVSCAGGWAETEPPSTCWAKKSESDSAPARDGRSFEGEKDDKPNSTEKPCQHTNTPAARSPRQSSCLGSRRVRAASPLLGCGNTAMTSAAQRGHRAASKARRECIGRDSFARCGMLATSAQLAQARGSKLSRSECIRDTADRRRSPAAAPGARGVSGVSGQ